jgi:hypothetical protein
VAPSASTASPSDGGGLGLELRDGVVEQAGLDRLLRPDVAALADAGALADAVAQVVELRAAHVAAGGDLDALDLRRVHGERALHADAERLLADGERLARAVALALDDDALEDLGPAAGALDDLEVHADAIARLEAGDAAQLRAFELFDDAGMRRLRVANAIRRAASRQPCAPRSRERLAATIRSPRDGRSAGRRERATRGTRRAACSAGTRDCPPARRRTTPRSRTPGGPSDPGSLRSTASQATIAASSPPLST